MSRVSSSTPSKPAGMSGNSGLMVPHEKIAMRAYEKWCNRGCPQGTSQQDWYEAEAELKAEMAKAGGKPMK